MAPLMSNSMNCSWLMTAKRCRQITCGAVDKLMHCNHLLSMLEKTSSSLLEVVLLERSLLVGYKLL